MHGRDLSRTKEPAPHTVGPALYTTYCFSWGLYASARVQQQQSSIGTKIIVGRNNAVRISEERNEMNRGIVRES